MIEAAGFSFRYSLPSRRFRRGIGVWAGMPTDPTGRPVSRVAFEAAQHRWLPSESDRAFVHGLMKPVTEPGMMAGWIAPPDRGINGLPVDHNYVRWS
jgi:benzoyl-CoA 2,3-dioxygenase component B